MIFDSIMGLTRRIDLVSPLDRLWLAWNNEAQRIFSPKGSAVCQYEGRVGPTHRSIEHAIGRVGRSDRAAQPRPPSGDP